MNCRACGQENRAGRKFCAGCGAPLVLVCSSCGASNETDERFCGECGQPLAVAPPAASIPVSVASPIVAPVRPTSFCDGRYEVKRFLGEGGKKLVYLAHDGKLDRDVAFSLIKTDGLDEEGLLRIKREAQAMGRLGDHPHIVSVFDIGEEHGQPYVVSQLMGGGNVEGLIERAENHRGPLAEALRIAEEKCLALEHAHSHGVVHRDLKPGNIWLTADGTAKLGDAMKMQPSLERALRHKGLLHA